MMIVSVSTVGLGSSVEITFADGMVWHDDASLPPDTALRLELAAWLAAGGVIAPYVAPPEPVPAAISDRQFAMEARDRGFLTQTEALAFVSSGTVPAFLAAIIAALPTQEARDDAEILVAGATALERFHPLTLIVGEAMRGETSLNDFLDDFFRAAGAR